MFESAEIGHTIARKEYKAREPLLREALLKAQYALLENASFPVIILVNGVDGAGKGETVNLLNEWMDPRHVRTEAFGAMTDADHQHPEMWRFWEVLRPKGKIGILFGSWYPAPILAHVMGHEKKAAFARRLEAIRHFERMLVAEGALVVKFWFHLSKKAARQRFKALEAMGSGAAIVSTSLGVEGIGVANEQQMLLADTPETFAAATLRLIADLRADGKLRRCLGETARAFVTENYDWRQIVPRLEAVYDQVIAQRISS